MRKLLGNSLKLPDPQLCSRLSELALDSAGRVKICPGGRPVTQCRRFLSAAVSMEGDEAGLGCCLRQNGNLASSSSSAGENGTNDNNTCCVITGSSQCFLNQGTTTGPQQLQQLQPVSGTASAPSSPVIGNRSVVQTRQTSPLICRRNLSRCACRRMTTMTQSQLTMDAPIADIPLETKTKASATFASCASSTAQEDDDDRDSDDDDDDGPTEGVPSNSQRNGVPYQAKAEMAAHGEAAKANCAAATEVNGNGNVCSTADTEGDNLTRNTEVDSCQSASRCWNCGHRRVPGCTASLFFCENCRLIQQVDLTVNFFDLFSLKQEFWLDEKELETRYKGLQKRLHPDLFATKSGTEKVHSAQQSAHAVNAYYTLKRPLSRAMYMVQIEAPEVGNDIEEGTVQDQSLLVEVMDFRERIEDANGNSGMLKSLADENSKKAVNNMEAVATVLNSKQYEHAKMLIQRWSYYKRIADEIDQQM